MDRMLDEMTPEEFDERMAHDIVEPWGEQWSQTGTIAAAVVNSITEAIFARVGKTPPAAARLDPEDFIPRPQWWEHERESRQVLTTDQLAASLERMV